MLKPRFLVARPLTLGLWLGSIAAVGFLLSGFAGCQGPDTFLRKPGSGAGGGSHGSGGSSFGTGGHGTGGTFGTGGSGVGGRIGTGGSAMGGTTGAGGANGIGGARDAGADRVTGAGGANIDASSDADTGVIGGNGPCAGLCANPIVLTMTSNSGVGLGTDATCHEVPGTVGHIVCGNFTTKVLSIDGTAVVCPDGSSATITVPSTTHNGGHCIQSTVGDRMYAYFSTY